MACQQTTSQLVGVTTTGLGSDLLEQCCAETGAIANPDMEGEVTPNPSPQDYSGNCPAPA